MEYSDSVMNMWIVEAIDMNFHIKDLCEKFYCSSSIIIVCVIFTQN